MLRILFFSVLSSCCVSLGMQKGGTVEQPYQF